MIDRNHHTLDSSDPELEPHAVAADPTGWKATSACDEPADTALKTLNNRIFLPSLLMWGMDYNESPLLKINPGRNVLL